MDGWMDGMDGMDVPYPSRLVGGPDSTLLQRTGYTQLTAMVAAPCFLITPRSR